MTEKEKKRRKLVDQCYLELAQIHRRIETLFKKCKQELNALNQR